MTVKIIPVSEVRQKLKDIPSTGSGRRLVTLEATGDWGTNRLLTWS